MELENPDLQSAIEDTSGLKQLVVNYIGNRLTTEEEVTIDMAVQVFSAEFPEFLLAIAEENFLRGYEQALVDLENHVKE
jgi:predicted double-glycine peptidase